MSLQAQSSPPVAPLATPLPASPGVKIVGRMETDTFCGGCAYNLHGLDVRLDDRLNIAVVQCPECGKYQAAGIATGAGRVWLNRLARMLIAAWVLFILGFIAAMALGSFIMQAVEFDTFLRHDWAQRTVMESIPEDFNSYPLYVMTRCLVGGLGVVIGWLFGAFLPVFLWHVRRRLWFYTALLVPMMTGLFMYWLFIQSGGRFYSFDWWIIAAAAARQAAFQIVGILFGIFLGRSVTRLILRGLLARRLQQQVRFLWEVDGKHLPGLEEPRAAGR